MHRRRVFKIVSQKKMKMWKVLMLYFPFRKEELRGIERNQRPKNPGS